MDNVDKVQTMKVQTFPEQNGGIHGISSKQMYDLSRPKACSFRGSGKQTVISLTKQHMFDACNLI